MSIHVLMQAANKAAAEVKTVPTMDDLKRYVAALETSQMRLVQELERLEAERGPNAYIYRKLLLIAQER